MKTKSLIMIAAAFGIAGVVQAEEGKKRPERKAPAKIIEKFDKDGDGKLNEDERAAAKAWHMEMMKARKKEMLKKFDKDGDGELNEAEREEAKAARKQMILEKFDEDGDGELNDDEKAAMKKAMKKRHGGPRGHRDGKARKKGSRDGKGKKDGPKGAE